MSKIPNIFRNLAKNKGLCLLVSGWAFIDKLVQLSCVNIYFLVEGAMVKCNKFTLCLNL